MQIIRAGVDSLYLAINGTLPAELIAHLAEAKAEASKDHREIPIELGESGVTALVPAGGQPGGYAFVFDTGPLGARFACKETSEKLDWNLFVKPHATALLSRGFGPAVRTIIDTLSAIGGQVVETSINRIDYAIDIRADDFTLDLARFIAHPKAKRRPHWSQADDLRPAAVLTGRRLESVTIGKMPGKQVILYDKTAEARAKQHPHWFAVWGIDPSDASARVWRLELRLGSHELKKVRRIRSFDALATELRPALRDLMQQVRYGALGETDQNVSRRAPDPIWHNARHHIETADLLGGTGDLPPGRLIEITQAMKIECHKTLINGNAAALAAVMHLDDVSIEKYLPGIVGTTISEAVPTDPFRQSLTRARRKRDVIFGEQ
jgi:hypothetical protein